MGQRAVRVSMVPSEVFQRTLRGLYCAECTLFKVSGQACCGLARCAPMPARAFQRILEPGAPSLALLFARRP